MEMADEKSRNTASGIYIPSCFVWLHWGKKRIPHLLQTCAYHGLPMDVAGMPGWHLEPHEETVSGLDDHESTQVVQVCGPRVLRVKRPVDDTIFWRFI